MLRYILPLKWYSDRILGTYTNVNALHLNESVLNGKSAHPQFAQERKMGPGHIKWNGEREQSRFPATCKVGNLNCPTNNFLGWISGDFHQSRFSLIEIFTNQDFQQSRFSTIEIFTNQNFQQSRFSPIKIFNNQDFHQSRFSPIKIFTKWRF